jgi:hypothetical protein
MEADAMRFRRRGKDKEDPADKALREARDKVKEIEERGEEVTALAESLKHMRERNHFAEQLEELIRRRGS